MSLNDPNWGRGSRGPDGSRGGPGGGNQGPPDLDELWGNFHRRPGGLFGRRRRGGGGGGPPDRDGLWRIFSRPRGELFGRRRRGGGDEPPRTPSSWQIGGGASLLAVLIVLVWLARGFFLVVEGALRPQAARGRGRAAAHALVLADRRRREPARRPDRAGLARERLLHRGRGPARGRAHIRPLLAGNQPRPALAPALADQIGRAHV